MSNTMNADAIMALVQEYGINEEMAAGCETSAIARACYTKLGDKAWQQIEAELKRQADTQAELLVALGTLIDAADTYDVADENGHRDDALVDALAGAHALRCRAKGIN